MQTRTSLISVHHGLWRFDVIMTPDATIPTWEFYKIAILRTSVLRRDGGPLVTYHPDATR